MSRWHVRTIRFHSLLLSKQFRFILLDWGKVSTKCVKNIVISGRRAAYQLTNEPTSSTISLRVVCLSASAIRASSFMIFAMIMVNCPLIYKANLSWFYLSASKYAVTPSCAWHYPNVWRSCLLLLMRLINTNNAQFNNHNTFFVTQYIPASSKRIFLRYKFIFHFRVP